MKGSIVAGLILQLCCLGAAADTLVGNSDLPLDPFHWKFVETYLAGAPDRADLGDGGGNTAQDLATLGREDLIFKPPFSHGRRTCKPLMKDGTPVDPVTFVAQRAPLYRVTMINEAHDMPQSRAFDAEIAQALRGKGYDLYGGETFYYTIGASGPAWPQLADGYYISEPIYGRLIRTLRRLGYRLFPYEIKTPPDPKLAFSDRINSREAAQAANLAAAVQAAPPSSKVLVHVGYGHLNKNIVPDMPEKMMGARFKETTGIDPLTVEQTVFWSPTEQFVVCDSDAMHLIPDPSQVYIGAARPSFTRNRPNWRLSAGDKLVEIPQQVLRPSQVAIYEARYLNEPDSAVPVDRVLVRPEETIPLSLPAGVFKVRVWTKAEGWSSPVRLSVDPPG